MPSLIAIDLGSYAVKVTALRRTGRRHAVEAEAAQRVPQDGSGVPDLDTRLLALDALLERNRGWQAPGTEVVAAWPADRTVMRRIRLPMTDKAQVAQALPFAVEGEVPFDLEEMLLGSRLFPGPDHTQAVVVLAPREPVSKLIEGMRERGVDPSALLAEGDLAAQLAPERGCFAVLDVGHARTVLAVVREGHTELVRTIDVAGLAFTRAIAGALQCEFGRAERIKHAAGGEPDPEATDPGEATGALPAAARAAVDAQMGLLLAEIRSTLIDAEDRLGTGIDQIIVTGGGARLPPLLDYLKADLGVPVGWATDKEGEVLAPENGVLVGLAARLVGQDRGRPVDMRVGDLAFRGGYDLLKTVTVVAMAGVGALVLAALVILVVQLFQLRAERAELDERLVQTVKDTFPDVGEVSSLTAISIVAAKVGEAEARAKVLGADSEEPPSPEILLALTQAMPPHPEVVVDVNDFTYNRTAVTFNAETDSYNTAATIETALKANPRFKKAEKSNEQKARDKVTFTMTIPLDLAGEEG